MPYVFVGLNSDPTSNGSYASIDYCWYVKGSELGAEIYESSSGVGGQIFSYTSNTVFSITYDGYNVRYWKDGVLLKSTIRSSSTPLYLDSSFLYQSTVDGVKNLVFGPMGEQGPQGYQGPPISLTGTLDRVTKFTGTGTTIGDSQIYDNGTNVGIGTTLPGEKLEVNGNLLLGGAGSRTLTLQSGSAGGSEIKLLPNSTAGYARINVGNTAQPLDFQMNSIDVMRILQNGNIGIGTTTPGAKLHIASANIIDTPSGDIMLTRYFLSDTDVRGSSIFHYYNSTTVIDSLVFGVAGNGGTSNSPKSISSAKMVIGANGNVGIGTITPNATLDVSGSVIINPVAATNSPFFTHVFAAISPFVQNTTNDADWTIVSGEAQSGNLTGIDKSRSGINYTFTAATSVTKLSYTYRTSTEQDYDYLFVIVDSKMIKQYSGSIATSTDSVYINGTGSHTIQFVYSKDFGTIAGTDTVWIDNVTLTNDVNNLTVNGAGLFSKQLTVSDLSITGVASAKRFYAETGFEILDSLGDRQVSISKDALIFFNTVNNASGSYIIGRDFKLIKTGDTYSTISISTDLTDVSKVYIQSPSPSASLHLGQFADADGVANMYNNRLNVNGTSVFKGTVTTNSTRTATPAVANTTGEYVYFGTGSGFTAGNLYVYNSSGTWVGCNASAASTSTGLLAIAQGTTPSAGMMVRGQARFASQSSYSTPTVGAQLWASTTVGTFGTTAPTATTQIVRIIGYCIDATNDIIYFCPDNTWIEIV